MLIYHRVLTPGPKWFFTQIRCSGTLTTCQYDVLM